MSNDLYECPRVYQGSTPSVFLAGGITNCPDWQSFMKGELREKCPGLIVFNPRRPDFDVNDKSHGPFQVKWEYDALHQARLITFWFPCETLCPITLYELGTWSALSKHVGTTIIVGCHPEYKRRVDVEIQLGLAMGPEFKVLSSLEELSEAAQKWYRESGYFSKLE